MLNSEARHYNAPCQNQNLDSVATARSVISSRHRFLFETDAALRSDGRRADYRVASLLAGIVAEEGFLDGLVIESCAERYTRTVLFNAESYCVLAIVWRPGQMSPVHSHRAWCALGVHAGTLTETQFEPVAGGMERGLRVSGCRQLHPGSVTYGPAYDPSAHRMANLGVEPAVSIHIYGTPFERLGSDLNQIWAD
jgi:predicted metal-dependent enzyme (double-stranded beta helix superfamily)